MLQRSSILQQLEGLGRHQGESLLPTTSPPPTRIPLHVAVTLQETLLARQTALKQEYKLQIATGFLETAQKLLPDSHRFIVRLNIAEGYGFEKHAARAAREMAKAGEFGPWLVFPSYDTISKPGHLKLYFYQKRWQRWWDATFKTHY